MTPIQQVPNAAQQHSKSVAGTAFEVLVSGRGLAIPEVLGARREGMSLSESSRVICSEKDSTSRFLQTLMVLGHAEREEATMILCLTDKVLLVFQYPKACERVLKLGCGTDWREADEGLPCVTAPMVDRPHYLLVVIWTSSVAGRMPRTPFPRVAVEVMKAARAIERRMRA